MQIVQKIDQTCAQNLPYYTDVTDYTSQKYHSGLACFNNLYDSSTKQVKQYQRVAKQLQIDMLWMLSQATDDFLEFIEDRIGVQRASSKQTERPERVLRIFNKLSEQHIAPHFQALIQMKEDTVRIGNNINRIIIVPLYLRVRATVEVSRELLLESFSAKMGELKMSYKYSKDHITMYWNGEFKEEKVVQKINEKFGELRQFTVCVAKKGMEIKISKQDLLENYHKIMSKLSELMQEVGEKGAEQWSETKSRTVDLYQTVLKRIRQRERVLKIKFEGKQIQAPKKPSIERLEERVQEPVPSEKAQETTAPSEPAPESSVPTKQEGQNKESSDDTADRRVSNENPAEPAQRSSEEEAEEREE